MPPTSTLAIPLSRSQTAARKLNGPSMSTAVVPGCERLDLRLLATSASADILSLYEVGVRRLPPTLDLNNTPGRHFLGETANIKFLAWMRKNYIHLSNVTRLSTIILFVMWAAPASVSRVLTPLAALGCLPIAILSPLVMSADVLKLLFLHHEFWFFTTTSATNWLIASILFNDMRVTGCIMCFVLNVVSCMMDANFRTIVLAARTGLAWIPAIISIVFVCVTKVVDIEPSRFKAVLPENKLGFTLANWFLNVNSTLVIFVFRQTFSRRRVFTAKFLHDRIVPCSTITCDLVLRRMRTDDRDSVHRFDTFLRKANESAREKVLCKPSLVGVIEFDDSPVSAPNTTKPNEVQREDGASSTSATQVMRVITPTLAFLDLRNALIPKLMPKGRIRRVTACCLYSTGLLGLLLAGFTMYLPAKQVTIGSAYDDVLGVGILSMSERAQTIIPATSLLCTVLFVAPFVASYQRDLLRALGRNFDFMFSSLQFHIASICLADMMHWDLRCLALVSWNLWFHWILIWDALVPELRERFHFKKVYGTPVLVGIMLYLLWITYSLFISSYDALDDRVLLDASWGSFELSIRTSTFLIGRLTTLLTWSLRLVWKALRSDEDDLIVIRGRVEYFTPLEFFPPLTSPPPETPQSPFHGWVSRRFRRHIAVVAPSQPVAKPPR